MVALGVILMATTILDQDAVTLRDDPVYINFTQVEPSSNSGSRDSSVIPLFPSPPVPGEQDQVPEE
jgi:hypothetical protein